MENLGLRIFEDGDSTFRHVNFRFVKFDHEDKITNIMSGYQDKAFEFFDDLQISCQIGGSADADKNTKCYGWDISYRQMFSVKLAQAEKMVKTLRRLEKGLAKLSEQFGYPETYADYVIRVAKVLKVKAFVFNMTNKGDMFTDNEYRFEFNIGNAKYSINQIIDKNIVALEGEI